MYNSISAKFVGWLCCLLMTISSLLIFADAIYPIINSSEHFGVNLANLKFDMSIFIRSFSTYFLLIIGVALPGRSRIVWAISIFSLVVALGGGIWVGDSNYIIIIELLSLIVLGAAYPYFTRQFYLPYGFVFIFAFIIFAMFYGTIGTYLLRHEFQGVHSIIDALYFTVITYSTVGYGDISPNSQAGKVFVMTMVGTGLIMFTTGITLIAYTMNTKLKGFISNINRGEISMTNHIILVGYGILTRILIEQCKKDDQPYLVIDQSRNTDGDKQSSLDDEHLMLSPYPGHVDTLVRARTNEAKIIIVNFESDSDTILAIMSVAEYLLQFTIRPKIIARIYYAENIEKAKKAGADEVVAPHLLAAKEIWKII